MDRERLIRDLGRADLCRFLAACYYEPAPELAEERVFDAMRDAALKVDVALASRAQDLGAAFYKESLDVLLVDYTRLFLGPTDTLARPYGSWWLTGEKTLMQDATMAILDLCREGGFEMDDSFRELPDHIAAELEFLYLLVHRGIEAGQRGDTQAIQKYARLRRRLLMDHLGRWIDPFTTAIEQSAETEFYRRLAELTRLTIGAEVQEAA